MIGSKVFLFVVATVLFLASINAQMHYIRPITGPGVTNGWDGDLGVPFWYGNRIYFLEGDILHQNHGRLPNAVGYCTDMANCHVIWNEINGGWPYPFYYLLGQSTVPAGAITINGMAYIFMMNVVNWGNGAPGNVLANSFGIKGHPPTPFAKTTVAYGDNSPFVNIAPAMAPDHSYVYLYGAGRYRAAPISLARVHPNQIENIHAFEYFSHMNGNSPVFSPNLGAARPIIGGGVGEISAVYSTYLRQYLVSYFDFQPNRAPVLRLANSSVPWGPFNTNTVLFDGARSYPWMHQGWGGPYGGYLVPDNGRNSSIVYVTLSLWVPYRVFILSVDLSKTPFQIVSTSFNSTIQETYQNLNESKIV